MQEHIGLVNGCVKDTTVKDTVVPVVEKIRSIDTSFDGSAEAVAGYATELVGLDKAQQRAALSLLGITNKSREYVEQVIQCTAAAKGMTMQQLAKKAAIDKNTAALYLQEMRLKTGKKCSDELTASMLAQILAQDGVNKETQEAILKTLGYTSANTGLSFSFKTLAANAKAAFAAMLPIP